MEDLTLGQCSVKLRVFFPETEQCISSKRLKQNADFLPLQYNIPYNLSKLY